jgi:hypothetical protein
VGEDLQLLCHHGGEFASCLHRGKPDYTDPPSAQWAGKQACGGDGILDGKVDAHTARGRHCMGRVADA